MFEEKLLYVIPARSGSVRIPQKNFKKFGGVPLFLWSVHFAKTSGIVGDIYVSTDSKKLQESHRHDSDFRLIQRSKAVSDSSATTESWLREFVDVSRSYDKFIVVLQPTSPLRNTTTFSRALAVFCEDPTRPVYSSNQGKPNGNLYICSSSSMSAEFSLTSAAAVPVESEFSWENLDLDEQDDWNEGEQLLRDGVAQDFRLSLLSR